MLKSRGVRVSNRVIVARVAVAAVIVIFEYSIMQFHIQVKEKFEPWNCYFLNPSTRNTIKNENLHKMKIFLRLSQPLAYSRNSAYHNGAGVWQGALDTATWTSTAPRSFHEFERSHSIWHITRKSGRIWNRPGVYIELSWGSKYAASQINLKCAKFFQRRTCWIFWKQAHGESLQILKPDLH